jgi:carboxymethylenebutenolidase
VARGSAIYAVERSTLIVQGRALSLHLPVGLSAPLPSVLIFHSAMGRSPSVLGWCDQLAERGFAAVALDFYDGSVPKSVEEALALRDSAVRRAHVVRESIELAYGLMASDPRLRSERRFLLGWSFGAAWATVAAGFLPHVTGVVAYYGERFSESSDLYETLRAPILFIGARRDPNPAPAQLEQIVETLTEKGKVARLVVVDGGHGFAERAHPNYDAVAAEAAWKDATQFLQAAQ